jgi:hypothetical protein
MPDDTRKEAAKILLEEVLKETPAEQPKPQQ